MDLPPTCTADALKALEGELWRAAPKSSRGIIRSACDILYCIERLDLVRLEAALHHLDKLTIKVRARVLDVVADVIGFLLEVEADPRLDGAEWKLEWVEKTIQIHVKDDCRNTICGADAREVQVPQSHPEFCSDECALRWLNQKGSEIAKLEDLDAAIDRRVDEALQEREKSVEQEIKEAVAEAAGDLAESEDNLVLEVIRLHGRDSRIDCATAARKLEALFRSGQLSI